MLIPRRGRAVCHTLLSGVVATVLVASAWIAGGGAVRAESGNGDDPTAVGGGAVVLPAGASFLTWEDDTVAAADVADETGSDLVAIYRWDAETGRWLHYIPGEPGWAVSLDVLVPGQVYVFITSGPVTIEFPGAAVTAPGS